MITTQQISTKDYIQLYSKNNYSFLQSPQWAEIKSPQWDSVFLNVDNLAILVLARKLPLFNKSFGYMPRILNEQIISKEVLEKLIIFCKVNLKLTHLIIDTDFVNPANQDIFIASGFKSANNPTIQPNQTNVVNLEQSEQDLWMNLKGNYRRNINKAKKHELQIEEFSEGIIPLERFYNVMKMIFSRTSYVMHGKSYFEKVWQVLSQNQMAKIYIALKNGVDMGAYLVVFDNLGAYELYGGTTDQGRDFETGYLLKWHAILDAKKLGKKYYDHWGIAKYKDGSYDKKSELYNISKFKKGFGGDVKQYIPQQFAVFSKLYYSFYRLMININKLAIKLRKFKS